MNPILNKNLFFVKEHRGIFKAANSYDIIDPENQQTVMLCREPDLGIFTKIFRFTDYKTQTPFNIVITDPAGKPILRVKRGLTIFRSVVEVFDHNEFQYVIEGNDPSGKLINLVSKRNNIHI